MEPESDSTSRTDDASQRAHPTLGTSGRPRGLAAGLVLVVALLVGGTTALAAGRDNDGPATSSRAPTSMAELMERMHSSPEAEAMHEQLSPELRTQMEQMHTRMQQMTGAMESMMGGEGMGGEGMGGGGMSGDGMSGEN